MTATKSQFKPLENLYDGMSDERKAKIHAKTSQMLASIELAKLRKAQKLTQAQMAQRINTSQANISKLENSSNVQLDTLVNYAHALGAQLNVTATLPDGRRIELVGG